QTATSAEAINTLFKNAANGELKDILGYEERPLVSIDYKTDPRSCVIDALSTMVINNTQVKIYAWYDNEWGYANRTAEIAHMIGEIDKA
ncbi:MAG: glyceraldehyde 3-phosphate dehydrogenase, partial [Candidatus Endobugula sp.]